MYNFKSVLCLMFCCVLSSYALKDKIPESKLNKVECEVQTIHLMQEIFISLVECLREFLQQGIPQIGIPSIDPLELKLLPIPLFGETIRGLIFMTDFKLTGLTGFELTEGNVTLFPVGLKFGLKFPEIRLTTNYAAKVTLFSNIALYGIGNIDLSFNDFGVNSSVEININPPSVGISKLFIEAPLPTPHTKVTGLLNNEFMSDIISRQLTETLEAIFEQEQDNLNELIYNFFWDLIQNLTNPYLKEFTLKDTFAVAIQIIGGGGVNGRNGNCEPIFIKIASNVRDMITTYYNNHISNFDLDNFNVENFYDSIRNM